MNRKLLVVVALMCGGLAVWLQYVWRMDVRQDNEYGPPVALVAIRSDLERGTVLEQAHLEVVRVPQRMLARLPTVVPADQLESCVGRTIRGQMVPGQLLMVDGFESESSEMGLSIRVPKGTRAITLAAEPVDTFSGLLRPGDRVDILASVVHRESGHLPRTALVSDVEVLAVGRWLAGGQPVDTGKRGTRARTLTLALDPQNAAQLKLVEQVGELSYLLRNRVDDADMAAPSSEGLELDAFFGVDATKQRQERQRKIRPLIIKHTTDQID